MNGDKELLKYMYENMDMGEKALNTITVELKNTDNKIKSNVYKALDEYKAFKRKCLKLAKKVKPEIKSGNIMATIMTKMGSKMEFMKDNSDSRIAEMLIQGYNMGILDITKKMKMYEGDISKDVFKFAKEYKKMMENGIESVKGFL